MQAKTLEEKVDLILEKVEKMEEILFIEEDEPMEDELLAIKEYLEKKRNGTQEFLPLEAIDEV